jgi:hypothetical protein
MWKLNKFLCRFDLSTGVKFLGYIKIIQNLPFAGFFLWILADPELNRLMAMFKGSSSTSAFCETIKLDRLEVLMDHEISVRGFYSLILIACMADIVICSNLIADNMKNKISCIMLWLIIDIICMILIFAGLLTLEMVISLILLAVNVYWWICVYSWYLYLKDEKESSSF